MIMCGSLFADSMNFGKLIQLMGGAQHYFETGFITYIITEGVLGGILFGYPYQNPKGLMLRGSIMITNSWESLI